MSEQLEKKVVGYLKPWSLASGEELEVMVSALVPGDYTAELVELICGDSRPHGTGFSERPVEAQFASSYPGREQLLRPGSYAVLPDISASSRISFCCYLYPTLLAREWQPLASGGGLNLDIRAGKLGVRMGTEDRLELPVPLRLKRWHKVLTTYDTSSGRLSLAMRSLGQGTGELAKPCARFGYPTLNGAITLIRSSFQAVCASGY